MMSEHADETTIRGIIRQTFKNPVLDSFLLRSEWQAYSWEKFRRDFHAALNVALMVFPQGMAYALIAGLPIQYGIFCSAIASIVGPFFCSSRLIILGPSNASSVLVMGALMTLVPSVNKLVATSLLVIMVGGLLILGAWFRVANLTQYISRSVVLGYMFGAALLICVNQLHNWLGIPVEGAVTFMDHLIATCKNLNSTHLPSLFLGLGTFICYGVCKRYLHFIPAIAATLVLMAMAGVGMGIMGWSVKMLAPLYMGTNLWTPPQLNFTAINQMASAAFAIALFIMLEGTFVSKSIANRVGQVINANQDLLGMGVANIFCAFFSGMPASTSPVRSMVNWSSGALTSFSSIVSGGMCLAAVAGLGFATQYIPLPVLAVIVICAAKDLVDWHGVWVCLKATKSDAIVFLGTYFATLLTPLDFSIFFGIGLSVILFLRKAGSPHLVEYAFNQEGNLYEMPSEGARQDPQISIIHVEGELFFGAADLFRDQIRRVCADPNLKVIVLRLKNARHLDATSVMALEELVRYLRQTNRHLIISGAMKDVYRVLKNAGMMEVIGRENFFIGSSQNPNVATRNALKRAQELLGRKDAEIRIFYPKTEQSS